MAVGSAHEALFPEGPSGSIGTETLQRLQTRDQLRWDTFVRAWQPLVFAWSRRLGLAPDDAAEVSQNVFLSLFSGGIDRFDRTRFRYSFRGWLYAVTRNACVDFRRRCGKQPLLEEPADLAQRPADGDVDTEVAHGVHEGMAGVLGRALRMVRLEFTEPVWRAFWRSVVDDVAIAVVAQELGISENAVYLARSRILYRLRSILDAEGLESSSAGAKEDRG